MLYHQYSALDFAQDPYFRKWMNDPDAATVTFWETWVAGHPEKREAIEEAQELVKIIRFTTYQPAEGKYEQIKASIDAAYRQEQHQLRRSVRPMYPAWQRLAAVLVGILLVGFAAWLLYPSTTGYTTAYGETKRVTLPDGSTAVLNANSTLRFSADWNETTDREVRLTGEAFFSVTHTENHQKFIVRTDKDASIEVLGTTFNVSSRPEQTKVTLNTGKIKLTLPGGAVQPVVMQPGEMVAFTGNAQTYVRSVVNPEQYSSWKDNKLVFSNTPVQEIVHLLEHTYGLEVTVSNPELLQQQVSGSVPSDNLDNLLFGLSEACNIRVIRQGDALQLITNNP